MQRVVMLSKNKIIYLCHRKVVLMQRSIAYHVNRVRRGFPRVQGA